MLVEMQVFGLACSLNLGQICLSEFWLVVDVAGGKLNPCQNRLVDDAHWTLLLLMESILTSLYQPELDIQ